MDTQNIPLKITAMRFVRAVRNLLESEAGRTAKLMFAVLVALLCGVNDLDVVNSYATAGVSTADAGRIIRPGADDILFLAQRPYLPPGTLRQVLERTGHAGEISDDRIFGLLRELNLEQVLNRAGGLDAERDWATLLSLREQQLLAFSHILLAVPRYAFLDRVGTALGSDQVDKILRMLTEASITYINNAEADHSLVSTMRSWSSGRMVAGRGQ